MEISNPVLVLGSNSCSAVSFIDNLLSQGKKVIGISRSDEVIDVFRAYGKNKYLYNFTFHKIDLNFNANNIVEIVNKNKVECIINFAAQSMVAQSWSSPEDWYRTNLVGLTQLCNLLVSSSTLKKFIHFSTPEVYGSTIGWVEESFEFSPSSPYAISRAASDWHLKTYFEKTGFPVIITRAANVYGAHQKLYRIIPKTIINILKGSKIPLHGGGNSVRSFLYKDDVNSALDLIIQSGQVGHSYHISSQNTITILSLVNKIGRKLGVNISDYIEIATERLGKDHTYMLDSTKIRRELNWSDKISIDDGIDKTILWIKDNFEVLSKLSTEYMHKK
jgi:dTDP-glucose 4,6-dehydratase